MAEPAPNRLPESLLVLARSTQYPPRCHRKRGARIRGKSPRSLASTQNCDAWTIQLNPTPSDPLQQDYGRKPPPNLALVLMRAYHSAPSLVRSPPLCSLGKS